MAADCTSFDTAQLQSLQQQQQQQWRQEHLHLHHHHQHVSPPTSSPPELSPLYHHLTGLSCIPAGQPIANTAILIAPLPANEPWAPLLPSPYARLPAPPFRPSPLPARASHESQVPGPCPAAQPWQSPAHQVDDRQPQPLGPGPGHPGTTTPWGSCPKAVRQEPLRAAALQAGLGGAAQQANLTEPGRVGVQWASHAGSAQEPGGGAARESGHVDVVQEVRPLPLGSLGEVLVAGAGVAAGYLCTPLPAGAATGAGAAGGTTENEGGNGAVAMESAGMLRFGCGKKRGRWNLGGGGVGDAAAGAAEDDDDDGDDDDDMAGKSGEEGEGSGPAAPGALVPVTTVGERAAAAPAVAAPPPSPPSPAAAAMQAKAAAGAAAAAAEGPSGALAQGACRGVLWLKHHQNTAEHGLGSKHRKHSNNRGGGDKVPVCAASDAQLQAARFPQLWVRASCLPHVALGEPTLHPPPLVGKEEAGAAAEAAAAQFRPVRSSSNSSSSSGGSSSQSTPPPLLHAQLQAWAATAPGAKSSVHPSLQGLCCARRGARFFRTGDVGFLMEDAAGRKQLVVLGRADHQVSRLEAVVGVELG